MRNLIVSGPVLCALAFWGYNANAQMYQVKFHGVAATTNASGGFATKSITDKTWINDISHTAGVTNTGNLMVVYHIQGSSFGDTIDVIDSKTGKVDDTLFGFYFGEAFGRMAITNAAGNSVKRLDYIYTKQNDHSFGDALVTKNTITNKNGTTRTTISGTMNYIITPDANGSVRVCNGTFVTGKQLSFTNSP